MKKLVLCGGSWVQETPVPDPVVEETALIRVLTRARDLLARGWCRGTFARAGNDRVVDASDERAQKFCLVGAIQRATADCLGRDNGFAPQIAAEQALNATLLVQDPCYHSSSQRHALIYYNDTSRDSTRALALIDKTLARYRK